MSASESASPNIGQHTFSHLIRSDRSTEQSLTIRNSECSFAVPGETIRIPDSIFIAEAGTESFDL